MPSKNIFKLIFKFFIAYEIARYRKIQEKLEEEKENPKTGIVRGINLPGIIEEYENKIREYQIELNEAMKQNGGGK